MAHPDFSDVFTPLEVTPVSKLNRAFRDVQEWLKGAPHGVTGTDISALAADNSVNSASSAFPALAAGDSVTIAGFSTSSNNATRTVVSSTHAKIVLSGGAAILNDPGGESVTLTFQQAFTERDAELRAPAFIHKAIDDTSGLFVPSELRGVYSGAGGGFEFRFLKDYGAASLTNGTAGRLIGSVSEEDEPDVRQLLGYLAWIRSGAGAGGIQLTTYLDGLPHVPFPLSIAADGKLQIRKPSSGTKTVNIAGDVRAAAYKKGGAALGKWGVDGTTRTYTGSAEATRWTAGSYQVDESQTLATNVNAEKLRGHRWPTAAITAVTTAPVACPARFGTLAYEEDFGPYTTVSVSSSDNSFNDSAGGFPTFFAPGDSIVTSGFVEAVNDGTWTLVSATSSKLVVSGGSVVTETAGASATFTFQVGFTTIAQTAPVAKAGYYKLRAKIQIPDRKSVV